LSVTRQSSATSSPAAREHHRIHLELADARRRKRIRGIEEVLDRVLQDSRIELRPCVSQTGAEEPVDDIFPEERLECLWIRDAWREDEVRRACPEFRREIFGVDAAGAETHDRSEIRRKAVAEDHLVPELRLERDEFVHREPVARYAIEARFHAAQCGGNRAGAVLDDFDALHLGLVENLRTDDLDHGLRARERARGLGGRPESAAGGARLLGLFEEFVRGLNEPALRRAYSHRRQKRHSLKLSERAPAFGSCPRHDAQGLVAKRLSLSAQFFLMLLIVMHAEYVSPARMP
jgi:hypothetical protein